MSGDQLPRDEADLDEVNTRLTDGLQSCRSVVANYKSLLTANDGTAANDDESLPVAESTEERP